MTQKEKRKKKKENGYCRFRNVVYFDFDFLLQVVGYYIDQSLYIMQKVKKIPTSVHGKEGVFLEKIKNKK
jgi:hypothetical protein